MSTLLSADPVHQHHHTISIGDDPQIQPVLTVDLADNNNNNNHNNNNKPPAPSSKPPSTKPRSSKPHKARSPSPSPPPPPPPPPPLQTIRLEIKLGGPSNYAVDIADIARSTGQRPPTPVRTQGPEPVSDSDDDHDDHGKDGDKDNDKDRDKDKDKDKKPAKKKKKKNPASEYYDVSDPFIDDSELAIDERTYFAQTKQQGFYVSSGEVALLKDKTPKKPKSRNPLLGGPAPTSTTGTTTANNTTNTNTGSNAGVLSLNNSASTTHKKVATVKKEALGARDSPGGLPSGSGSDGEGPPPDAGGGGEQDERAGQKRKRYITVMEGGKKRKVVDVQSFHPDLQAAIELLKSAISNESWDQKGKFPPALKPLLAQLAVLAIKLNEYDEHFFNLMPVLFPYNKFTMSKLIKRTVFHEHTELLMQRQEALLAELAAQAQAGFAKAEEEWEKSVVAWDKRQEKLRVEAASGVDGSAGGGTDSGGPTRHPTEEMDVDGAPGGERDKDGSGSGRDKDKDKDKDGKDKDGKDKDKDKDGSQHPPAKKYRMTEGMKAIVWQLVLLSNECCRLENEKNTLEGSVIQVSEQGLRKALYQKIVAAFPEGWMSSGQISRDVSAMKKKFEKEAMENEA